MKSPGSKDRNQSAAAGFTPVVEASVQSPDEDVQRMLAFCAGDDAAFDALFERWSGRLLRYLERMLREPATAEELVQEAFLRVYRARDRYSPDARFSTWLYRIATNLALNELRRPLRREPHDSLDADGAAPLAARQPAIDDVVGARRTGVAVETAIASLPERQRLALWLSAVEGESYAEIALALEVTEPAVKALVHRARVNLMAELEPGSSSGGK